MSDQAAPAGSPDIARVFQSVFQAIETRGLAELQPPLRVEPVEYRTPPYSYLALVRIHSNVESVPAYVKILRLKDSSPAHHEAMRTRVANEFEAAATVHRGLVGEPRIFSIRPLGCFPDHLACITAEAPGEPLIELLERDAAWRPANERLDALRCTLEAAGAWLRRFQSLKPSGQNVPREALVEYLDVRLKRLVRQPKAGFSEVDRTRLLRYSAAKCQEIDENDLRAVWTHADFGPSNVLVHEGRIAVLDFAMAQPSTMFTDVARMHTQLEWFAAKPQFHESTIRSLQQALLAGFDPQLTSDAPLFEMMVLQHRVNHFLGVVERNEGVLSTIYNWHLARRDRGWMRSRTSGISALEPA